MFKKYILPSFTDEPDDMGDLGDLGDLGDSYHSLSESCNFENVATGRAVANLVDLKNNLIPLVRTTSVYKNPNQCFSDIHRQLIDRIQKALNPHGYDTLRFNNALVEIYDSGYTKMGYHSDQSLDLNPDSSICIFSCYSDPSTHNLRTLKIKRKENINDIESKIESNIVLEHNSCVIFSTEANKKHLHKIILEKNNSNKSTDKSIDKWLGFTFRVSDTFIYFTDGIPYFSGSDVRLSLADETEKKDFFKNKSLENSNINFVWPKINYTVNCGDLIPINISVADNLRRSR
jgi:hypothetical protein